MIRDGGFPYIAAGLLRPRAALAVQSSFSTSYSSPSANRPAQQDYVSKLFPEVLVEVPEAGR